MPIEVYSQLFFSLKKNFLGEPLEKHTAPPGKSKYTRSPDKTGSMGIGGGGMGGWKGKRREEGGRRT